MSDTPTQTEKKEVKLSALAAAIKDFGCQHEVANENSVDFLEFGADRVYKLFEPMLPEDTNLYDFNELFAQLTGFKLRFDKETKSFYWLIREA
jgi:hypothetical protein